MCNKGPVFEVEFLAVNIISFTLTFMAQNSGLRALVRLFHSHRETWLWPNISITAAVLRLDSVAGG